MGSETLRRLCVALPWAALVLLAALLSLEDIRSNDYWWHLRAGQLIAETGAVPRVDPFTYTAPGARWIDIHWLYQLLLHPLYAHGGHAAVVLSHLALVALLLAGLAPIGYRRERAWLSAAALGLMLLLVADRIQARPELPSFVLLAWILRLLDRDERVPDRRVFTIAPLVLVWANMHGLFAVGIAVCAIELAAELLRGFGRAGEGMRWARVRRLALLLVLVALVPLANPNGLEGALYPLQQLDMVSSAERRGTFGMVIDELKPSFDVLPPLLLGLFVAMGALSLGAIAANWQRVREADVLLWVAFLYLAVGAARNTSLFAIVAAPILVRNANEALGPRLLGLRARAAGAALATGLALLVSVDAVEGRWFARSGPATQPGLGVAEGLNPIGAAEWIARAKPPGPIAHAMRDGGYLIWRLWPEYRVMSDGRLEVFGPERLLRLQPTDPERFAALDAEYRFGTVLLNHRRGRLGPLVAALRADPGWRLAYADDVSVVFVRGDADAQRWPALDLDAPGLFASTEGTSAVAEERRLSARARLLLFLGRPDLALRVWEEALRRHPDLLHGAEVEAGLRALATGAPLPRELRERALANPAS